MIIFILFLPQDQDTAIPYIGEHLTFVILTENLRLYSQDMETLLISKVCMIYS